MGRCPSRTPESWHWLEQSMQNTWLYMLRQSHGSLQSFGSLHSPTCRDDGVAVDLLAAFQNVAPQGEIHVVTLD